MMAYLILILMAPAYNSFAYEGRGIQTYFTAPLRSAMYFWAKNLMLVSVLSVEIALSLAMLAVACRFAFGPHARCYLRRRHFHHTWVSSTLPNWSSSPFLARWNSARCAASVNPAWLCWLRLPRRF